MMAFNLSYHANMDIQFLVEKEPLNVVRAYYTLLQAQRKAENDAVRNAR